MIALCQPDALPIAQLAAPSRSQTVAAPGPRLVARARTCPAVHWGFGRVPGCRVVEVECGQCLQNAATIWNLVQDRNKKKQKKLDHLTE